ncbi:MAG TPA: ParB/RepB/Spo0J family partition protein, partial [Rhizomicrobium sp.]|nr:ParB/RepB/Spo0J family partition protein [Rhizomicrobium sp.]
MELRHIPIEKLHDTKINMRHDRKPPDVSDLLPGIRQRGILQTLLVRPFPERGNDEFEIVSGRRRYWSGRAIVAELGEIAPLPCGVMEAGDDAAAIEASLMENLARRDADPMTEYETFARLIKEGRKIDDIAATFGLTVLTVKQRLALANLLPKIRDAYRAGEIDDESIRHLTLASKGQQKDWLKLFESKNGYAPHGWQLKQWLFGGQQISTKVALFPLEDYKGHAVTDLFGDDTYFADADLFWQLQNAAIEAKRDVLREAGWADVIVLEPGAHFATWEHDKTPKKKGGKVYITVSHTGEVELYEGWLNRKEARKAARSEVKGNVVDGESATSDARPQMTQAMENYIELHRHAVARLALLGNPGVAFRLLIAHAIASSGNWSVKPDPQRARSKEIENNIARSEAQAAFALERQSVLALLDWPKAEFAANPGGEADTV